MAEIPIKHEGEPQKESTAFPSVLRDTTKVNIEQLMKTPRWRKLEGDEIEHEKGELQRTAEELQLAYPTLERAFDNAQLESLSDADWSLMTNTDSQGTWTKDDVITHIGSNRDCTKIFGGLENGDELPAPIVLLRDNEPPYLIGGNTRLLACKALKIQPQILAVRI